MFAKIFVRIEITEQESSPTKTSSLIKIFGWSIFENTVKHARNRLTYNCAHLRLTKENLTVDLGKKRMCEKLFFP